MTVVERRYLTVKVRDADGEERYESQPEDRVVETRAVTTGGDGRTDLTFTPPTGGLYRIAVTGRDAAGNEFRSASAIYVTAAAFVPWQVTNDERLQLVADRTGYQPGDVARVLVPAPFAGAIGLVTVERQGVIAREVRTFTGNSEVLEVPIAATYLPNVFVSVALFKAPGPDNPIPEFRSGFVELEVSAESQRLNISLTADRERLGPRESVTFTVKTTDAAATACRPNCRWRWWTRRCCRSPTTGRRTPSPPSRAVARSACRPAPPTPSRSTGWRTVRGG
ncbi:MAG: hypothetical protein U0531_06590 [Dehalococcoidia bacterium]